MGNYILFYSILFNSILFYSILFYFFLFRFCKYAPCFLSMSPFGRARMQIFLLCDFAEIFHYRALLPYHSITSEEWKKNVRVSLHWWCLIYYFKNICPFLYEHACRLTITTISTQQYRPFLWKNFLFVHTLNKHLI